MLHARKDDVSSEVTDFATIVLDDDMLTTVEIAGALRVGPSERGAEETTRINTKERTAANRNFLAVFMRKE